MPIQEIEWKEITSPAQRELPIDKETAKNQAGLTTTKKDGLIERGIRAASREIENRTSLVLMARQYEGIARKLPTANAQAPYIELPRVPFVTMDAFEVLNDATPTPVYGAVDASVYYTNSHAEPARIERIPGQAWPSSGTDRQDAYRIKYTAGHSSPIKIPETIQQALLMFVAHLIENPEAVRESRGGQIVEVPMGFWELVGGEDPPSFGYA